MWTAPTLPEGDFLLAYAALRKKFDVEIARLRKNNRGGLKPFRTFATSIGKNVKFSAPQSASGFCHHAQTIQTNCWRQATIVPLNRALFCVTKSHQ